MNVLITICARGGSKGINGKNIILLNNKPLISYTISLARQLGKQYDAEIELSTDSPEIKETAKSFGLTTEYLRPGALATDRAGKIAVINDLLQYAESKYNTSYDYLIDLDVTSPIRTSNDISEGFNLLQQDPQAFNLFSVSPAKRNPYFNMVEQNESGYYQRVKQKESFLSRQSAPEVFDMNAAFYIYRRAFFNLHPETPFTDRTLVYVMPHLCVDIDHWDDLSFIEYLLEKGLIELP
ncbi:MAG: acylneuraminate cytidylyltransferase family protein [Bacteroidales bacterium]|nr:acylneuraminate cytidylyltransferase family protein [Bacteroidales bacterium]